MDPSQRSDGPVRTLGYKEVVPLSRILFLPLEKRAGELKAFKEITQWITPLRVLKR